MRPATAQQMKAMRPTLTHHRKERVEQLSGVRTREQRKHVTQVRARMTGQRHVSAFAPYAARNAVEGPICPAPVGEHRLRENGGPR